MDIRSEQPVRNLSEKQIHSFRNEELIKSFYKFIKSNSLRTLTLNKINSLSHTKDEEKRYEDL